MELKSVKEIVEKLLRENEELRDDDDLLIVRVYKELGCPVYATSFNYVMRNRKHEGLPSFECIRRTRQKVQADIPELKGSERVQRERELKEYEYRDFAKE